MKNKKLLKLKYWREYLDLGQTDLAMLLGCKRPCYCKKELGTIDIRRSEMMIIQKEFNKKLKDMGLPLLTLDEIFD